MKTKNDIYESMEHDGNGMTRRDILRLFAAAVAAAALPSLVAGCKQTVQTTNRVSSAWIPKGSLADSYAEFKAMVEAATDFSWLSAGDSVLVKIAADSAAGYPACTDPTALKFMLRLLQEKNAGALYVGDKASAESVLYLANTAQSREVISAASAQADTFVQSVFSVLNTSTIRSGSTRGNCVQNGLLEAINDTGATPVFFDESAYAGFDAIASSNGNWNNSLYIANVVSQVKHIVNMPQCVDDARTGASTGMMNMAGLLRDDCRIAMASKGADDFYKMCADVSLLSAIDPKIRLTMTSGMSILTTAGTDPGTAYEPDHGMIFASDNLLAHDLMAASWVEANKAGVDTGVDVYELPLFKYYIGKKGDPSPISWVQVNSSPGTDTAGYVKAFLKV